MAAEGEKYDYGEARIALIQTLGERDFKLINLKANSFQNKEIGRSIDLVSQTVKNRVSELYGLLEINDELQLGLLWVRMNRFWDAGLLNNVNLEAFKRLTAAEKDLMNALTRGRGSTTAEMGKELGLAAQTIRNDLTTICTKVCTGIRPKRVGLAVAYELFTNPDIIINPPPRSY